MYWVIKSGNTGNYWNDQQGWVSHSRDATRIITEKQARRAVNDFPFQYADPRLVKITPRPKSEHRQDNPFTLTDKGWKKVAEQQAKEASKAMEELEKLRTIHAENIAAAVKSAVRDERIQILDEILSAWSDESSRKKSLGLSRAAEILEKRRDLGLDPGAAL